MILNMNRNDSGISDGRSGGNGSVDGKNGLRSIRGIPAEAPTFLAYLAVTLFLTWPLITRFTTSIYGMPGDNLGEIWAGWWCRNAGSFGASASFCPLVGFPFGTELGTFPMEPLDLVFRRFFLLFFNEVIVYNLLMFLSFFLSGITMYYLVRYLTGDRRLAFFGGLAYLVMPFHAVHSLLIGGGLSMVQWMPLYILVLIKFTRKSSGKNAAYLALGAILVAGTSVHYALFMGVFTAAFLAGRFIAGRISLRRTLKSEGGEGEVPRGLNKKTLVMSLLVILVVVVVVLPFFYFSVAGSNQPGKWPTSITPGESRSGEVIVWGAASPADYILPNVYNPIMGEIFRTGLSHGGRFWHRSLYAGWVIIVLAAIGLFFAARGKDDPRFVSAGSGQGNTQVQTSPGVPVGGSTRYGQVTWGFASAALVCFVLSLKPEISFGSFTIPMPSKIFGSLAPWFRWYMRIGVVVNICLILIACFGFHWLLDRLKGRNWALLMVPLTIVLVLEMIIVPPFQNFRFDTIPEVFRGVTRLPENSTLAFYPVDEGGAFTTSNIRFYQRWFEKPMLNGASGNSDGEALRRTVYNPFNEATPGILSRFDISNLVLFDDWYRDADPDGQATSVLPPGLDLVESFDGEDAFGNAHIFRVSASKADLVPLYLGDISVPVLDEGTTTARLVVWEGVIRILNFSGGDAIVNLRLPVSNPFTPREVVIENGGQVLWRGDLDSGEEVVAEINDLVVPGEGIDLHLFTTGTIHRLTAREIPLFGTEFASFRVGDLGITVPGEENSSP